MTKYEHERFGKFHVGKRGPLKIGNDNLVGKRGKIGPLPFLPRDVQVKTPHLPRPLRALPVQSFRLATAQLHP